ncbi:MAG: CDP-alcohol phosphatidyltransferase family protein [bacterium]|nr:CDP-alcohol phosphatidyltransferase family protein [bacterium]
MKNNIDRPAGWMNKPTDRFVLKWTKRLFSAPISLLLYRIPFIKPTMITVSSMLVGIAAGVIFALGWGWVAGIIAAFAQILDGVDGQVCRLRGAVSKPGAFLDSVLDRYVDTAFLLGMLVYLVRLNLDIPYYYYGLAVFGFLAVVGNALISYGTARAETLNLDIGKPTLASKGTRMAVMIACALVSGLWPPAPLIALIYLAVHCNGAVAYRVSKAYRN